MIKIGLILIFSLNIVKSYCNLFEYYHTTQKINEELQKLSLNCSQDFNLIVINNSPFLQIVQIGKNQNKAYKGFLLFGEHPREMISSETGLQMLKEICEQENKRDKSLNFILQNFELNFLINANPVSRDKVEQGQFCLRENENGVDINRNYDSHWEFVDDDIKQVSSGKKPFSEIETQKIRDALQEFKPHYFITIHSGTLGLYTPYAYSENLAERNEENMLKILNDINEKYCDQQCDVGAAGKQVGYLCPGTSLDWVYDNLQTNYSFAMEIYDKKINLFNQQDQRENNILTQNFQAKKFLSSQNLLQERNIFDSDYDKCFLFFNPDSQEEYQYTIKNWSKAIFRSLELTAEFENNKNKIQNE